MRPGFNFYFALKTVDDEGNWSDISNKCLGLGFTDYLMVDPQIVQSHMVGDEILFMFRTNSASERAEILIYKMKWNTGGYFNAEVIRHLVDGNYPAGVHPVIWDWKTDQGENFFNWPFSHLMVHLLLDGVKVDEVGLRREY
jgi:hypothetical protein